MEGIPYADILILALIAGFILLRLRSVLGQKSEDTPPSFFGTPSSAPSALDPVVHAGDKAKARSAEIPDAWMDHITDSGLVETITGIKKVDPEFTLTNFMQGAKMAYEMIFDAFAKGDQKTLELLLDPGIYQNFSEAINVRNQSDQRQELTLVSVVPKALLRAKLQGTKAELTVLFESEQVSLTKDASGAIVAGNPHQTTLMDDEWVFVRDVASKNPNWKILET